MQQIMPCWMGFFISVRENVPVLGSTVDYFETINAPMTKMSTIYEILKRTCRIKDICKGLRDSLEETGILCCC